MLVHPSDRRELQLGGKAQNLLKLAELGIQVPPWVILPASSPENFSDDRGTEDEIAEDLKRFFGEDGTGRYAVRSSALDEDGLDHSFAGQFETFLNVPPEQVASRISDVLKSVQSERVLAYRKSRNLKIGQEMAVIVQKMITPEVSGVAFGVDPIRGESDTKLVSAVYGVGEGLVSGQLDADHYTLSPRGIHPQIARKTAMLIPDENGGLREVEVDADRQHTPALAEAWLIEIAGLLDRLEEFYHHPQDIEFALAQGELYLLQTRPVTTLKPASGEYTVWDNSNIIESYPGVTTPLTFSFIIEMYAFVYRQFVGLMGVSEKDIDRYGHVFDHTLGLVRGRVYYNLLSWYKMLAMVPGYSLNARFMENMMGVRERFDLQEDMVMSRGRARWKIFKMIFRMLWLQLTLRRERRKFKLHLDKVIAAYSRMDFDAMNADEIIERYKTYERDLLLKWKAPLINDFFSMVWFGLLQKFTSKHCPEHPNIHNDLLCGSSDIISVEPIHRSLDIAREIRSLDGAHRLFREREPGEIWKTLRRTSEFSALYRSIRNYLHDFGERCVGELKLETTSYAQDPEKFIRVLKGYITSEVVQREHSGVEEKLRTDAEGVMKKKLRGRPLAGWWFSIVLSRARDLVSNRENLRYERTRGFGMVRKMMTALGRVLTRSEVLSAGRDIFFLELEELLNYKEYSATELQKMVAERKAEFRKYRESDPPVERFYTYGEDFSDAYIYSTEKQDEIREELKGTGCCPGKVRATVRVVMDPSEVASLNGDILVTSSTDPGWVTLFPTVSGILVERGSLLSHSAIVSREMGIPCIVGVEGLLRSLKSGQEVLMDGSTGEIKVLNNE